MARVQGKENFMATTSPLATLPNPHPHLSAAMAEGQRSVRPHPWQPPATPRRRWNRATTWFWLGGLALGTAGGVLGASMPHRYPVGAVVEALWSIEYHLGHLLG